MHPSSCMVGPLQGTAAQFSNRTPHYGGTTWQSQQTSGYVQPANAFFLKENGLVTNGTSNRQNWQGVTPTTSGLQPNHFINQNQQNSSLNAHNGQSFLSNGSFPVQNFQPQSSGFSNSAPPNTNIYSKQDMSQLGTQKQTHNEKQPVSVQKTSILEYYLSNQIRKVSSNLNNQLDNPFPVQTTPSHSREQLKDYPSNQQMVNNRHDSQTLRQQGLSACAQQSPDYFSAIQAKTTIPTGMEYGVQQHMFQHSNVNQTSAQHQRQVSPAVNQNIVHPKHGHQMRDPGIRFDSCEAQTGSSSGSSYTRAVYIQNNRIISQRQSNHNTIHATLNTPLKNLDTPQSLPPCSGQPSSASNACNPAATVDNNNPSFDKKSFKAIAVVQPLEQECSPNGASKNNSCDKVDASTDKSASDQQSKTSEMPEDKGSSKVSGVQPSSVTTIPWTIKTLTKLLEDNELAQQKEVMGLTKVNALSSICNVAGLESAHKRHVLFTLMKTAADFCRHYVTTDSVILTEVKGSYDENYCVLKHGELYSEPPYKSQWLNVGELDDIDKEFGYASGLKYGTKKQSDQAPEVTSIPAQIVKNDSVIDVTVIEPESTDPGKEKRTPERRSSVELTQDHATAPIEDSSVDSSDSECSLEINVLPPDEAKIIYEQIQKKTEEAIAMNKPPKNDSGSSDQGKVSQGGNVTESEKRVHTEYCCLQRFFNTFFKKDTSDSKCQCGSAKVPADNTEKNSPGEKEAVKETSFSLVEGGTKEIDKIEVNNQTMKRSGSQLLQGLNQPVSRKENKQHCHDSDMAPIQKDIPSSHNPMLVHLLLHENTDEDLCGYFAKIRSDAKVNCTDAASHSEKTCYNTEMKLMDTTLNSPEGTDAQSSLNKMPHLEDLPTKGKKGHCEEENFHPTLIASKKCSNQVDGNPPCSKSQVVVIDLTEDEPVSSSESPSGGHLLPCQSKDDNSSSYVDKQMGAQADDFVLISDSEQTFETTSDSSVATEAQSPTSEAAMTEGFAPDDFSTVDEKSLSPKSPKVPVHLTERESVPLKKKVVKLMLFGSGSSQKMTVVKRPPKVLSVNLSSLKYSPSKPISMQEQSAKQRVYEKWKTSIVPVLTVSKKKEGTRKGSSILGVDRNKTVFVGSTVTKNVPISSETWICKRKRSEKIGLKLKKRKLSSPAKPAKWKGGSESAAKDRDSAAVTFQENDDRRFRIPTTF